MADPNSADWIDGYQTAQAEYVDPESAVARAETERDVYAADLTAAQQEIERLGGQLTTEASLTASWIEQCERYKARAETAEADASRERELGKSHFTRAISAEAALEDVEAERDKLRELLALAQPYVEASPRSYAQKLVSDMRAALASTTTPAPVDEEERG